MTDVLTTVRAAKQADVGALAETLASAFQHDPVMSWILPDPRRRADGLPWFFSTLARHYFVPLGACELATRPDGTIGGATLWAPPGPYGSFGADLRAMPGLWRAFGRRMLAGKTVGDLLQKHHPREPHWYLSVIGTAPDVRGGGYGSALLRSRLDRCDTEGTAAYLESSSPTNLAYYERFGFVVTDELHLPDGPSVWPMWREPRA
ncbi:GNAT family N-acetyltransferase [Nocardia caishijiensis]|uniref:GNAT family N-acetyltransferase n=1 Tax=Nocardia caishijiensis TaxID=184756 RepID=UPI00082AD6F2|nr:GNAT family N-acetyltransferase [Nocardia caishijiensis]